MHKNRENKQKTTTTKSTCINFLNRMQQNRREEQAKILRATRSSTNREKKTGQVLYFANIYTSYTFGAARLFYSKKCKVRMAFNNNNNNTGSHRKSEKSTHTHTHRHSKANRTIQKAATIKISVLFHRQP